MTEILDPGRKRGDEYRCEAEQGVWHFDPYLGETIANQLAKGVKKKADKRYMTTPLLLVYLNILGGGRLGGEVEFAIERLPQTCSAKYARFGALSGADGRGLQIVKRRGAGAIMSERYR